MNFLHLKNSSAKEKSITIGKVISIENEIVTIDIGNLSLNLVPLLICVPSSLLVGLLMYKLKLPRWFGPADTIYAAHHRGGILDLKGGFGSTLASFISISGGASVGIYGPLVHFGATVSSFIRRQKFIPKIPHDIIIGSGVAAAISAGFGAPLAGIIFAHEAVLRHFSMRALAPIAIASFTASAITEKIFNKSSIFQTNNEIPELANILPITLACSPIFALSAITFMICIRFFTKIIAKSKLRPAFLIYSGALICGITGIFFPPN
mgnify:CR=1 FL=1